MVLAAWQNQVVAEDPLDLLGEIYAAGGLPDTPTVRAARLLQGTLGEIGADVGFLGTPTESGEAVDVFRVTRASQNLVRLAFPAGAPYPLAHALRTGRDVFVASNEQLRCDHPGLVRVESRDHACATVVLRGADDRPIGAMNVAFDDPHEFRDDELQAIAAAAERCAAALRG